MRPDRGVLGPVLEPGSNQRSYESQCEKNFRAWPAPGCCFSTSTPEATYVEDNDVRPDVDLRTTQLELGLLYDLSTFPVAGKIAPFMIGGGE